MQDGQAKRLDEDGQGYLVPNAKPGTSGLVEEAPYSEVQ